jgi:hypothetical protein
MKKKLNIPYQFDITLIMEKRGNHKEERRLYLRKGKNETFLHILFKLLAYCYFWDKEKDLIIEPNFRFRKYKPDLISFKPSEIPNRLEKEVKIWVECKKVALKKLKGLVNSLPHSEIYWFHKETYFQKVLKSSKVKNKLRGLTNLNLIGIKSQKYPIDSLALELGGKNPGWMLKRLDTHLKLTTDILKEIVTFSSIKL